MCDDKFMGVANAFIEVVNEKYINDNTTNRAIIVLATDGNRLSRFVKGSEGNLHRLLFSLLSEEDFSDIGNSVLEDIVVGKFADFIRGLLSEGEGD